jgi:protein TonB
MSSTARGLAVVLLAIVTSAPARAAELVVAWAPLAAAVDGYQIERRVDEPGEPFKPIARVASSATRFTDQSVSPGVRYCYRVRGVRGYEMSPPSPPLCNAAAERAAGVPLELESTVPEPAPVTATPAPPGENREAKALHRPPPKYPIEAQLGGISGWVKLAFTVTSTGSTRDVRVVASEPPGVFDRAAIDAAERFVYAPRLENGVPVDRPNVETEITFTWIDRGGSLTTGRRSPAPR